MSRSIPKYLYTLLSEVSLRHKIDLPIESVATDGWVIDEAKRELLIDALINELAETGLCKDDEPNERGLQLEELIDFVNCYRRPPSKQ